MESEEPATGDEQARSGSALTVLIVDDEGHARLALREALAGAGHAVVDEAADAKTAVALTVLHEPDVVVLDHHLSGRFGGEVITEVLAASPQTAVVIFTANDTDALRRGALDAGAVAVVDKAGGHAELLTTLASLRP